MPGSLLRIEPLTGQSFASFGTVITVEGAEQRLINEGTTTRFHDLAAVDVAGQAGRPCISVFLSAARDRPIAIRMLERHPLGSQAFIPLQRQAWLVVVAEGAASPDLSTLRCFRVRGDEGVSYARNTWHHPVLTLVPTQEFVVIDRAGPGDNLEEYWFDEAEIRLIESEGD